MNIQELSEKLKAKGFIVQAKVMKKSSRNMLGEECKAEYIGRVDYFRSKDQEDSTRLYLTHSGLHQNGLFSKDPVCETFTSEVECSSALRTALINYFVHNVVRHFHSAVETINLGCDECD